MRMSMISHQEEWWKKLLGKFNFRVLHEEKSVGYLDMESKNKIVTNFDSSYNYVKRGFDIILTLLASPFLLVIIIVFAIIIKIDSKGPAFYSQYRLGKNGIEFKIYKLRSMKTDAEIDSGAVWAEKDDPRITKVGKFIRKVRIDELPQFFNVLIGDMSIIGPRPERKVFSDEFCKYIPNFEDRLQVKPGITGLAQINGGYEHSPEDKLKFDIEYINNYSFKQDLMIFLKTFSVLLTGDGAR